MNVMKVYNGITLFLWKWIFYIQYLYLFLCILSCNNILLRKCVCANVYMCKCMVWNKSDMILMYTRHPSILYLYVSIKWRISSSVVIQIDMKEYINKSSFLYVLYVCVFIYFSFLFFFLFLFISFRLSFEFTVYSGLST